MRQLVAAARMEENDLLVAEDVREIAEDELLFQFGRNRGGFPRRTCDQGDAHADGDVVQNEDEIVGGEADVDPVGKTGLGDEVVELGLTGDAWPGGKRAEPVAWRLRVLGAGGRVLAEERSFLWVDSAP